MIEQMNKGYLGILSLVVGVVLFTLGLSPLPNSILEVAMMAIGAVLIFFYVYFSFEWFERYFGREARTVVFAPAMATLGCVIIYQSSTAEWIVPSQKIISLALGALLIGGSLIWIKSKSMLTSRKI